MDDHQNSKIPSAERRSKRKPASRAKAQPAPPSDPNRDLRHVRPRGDQPDELREARLQARQRRRRKLMITRMLIVLSIVLIVALIATAVVIKIVADQKSARGEKVRFLAVKEIVVEGKTHYTDQEIIKASKLYVGQSLLSVDKSEAARRLVEQLPYLDANQVVVDNASFYTLRIRVAEVPVIAAVKLDKDWMILGTNNHAMERVPADNSPKGVVRIEGASFRNKAVGKTLLDERSLRICSTLISEAGRCKLQGLTTINIASKTRICLYLNDRLEVVLGSETNLPNKIKALTETLPVFYGPNGKEAAGRLNMMSYSDDDKHNDKVVYTTQEDLDKQEQEHNKPMAAVLTGDDWTIINAENLVLRRVSEKDLPRDIVRITGATYQEIVVGKELLDVRSRYICHTLIQEAKRQEKVQLVSVDIHDRANIMLQLKEGLQVRLGDSSALENQIKALASVLPTVWAEYGEDAAGILDMTTYSDENPDNDKAVYAPPVAA